MRHIIAAAGLLSLAGCGAGYSPPPECSAATPAIPINSPELEPSVWDDGSSTYFRFPGNARLPTFYVVNPDGKEAVTDYTVDPASNMVVIHQTARQFKLRDGNQVACIVNHAWNPVGYSTGTGTTNPNIAREPKGSRK